MNRVLKVMKVMNGVGAIGAVSGLVTGWTYCDVSESPMLNEKAGSAIMLAFSLFGGAVASPIIIPFSLLKKYENRMRGKDIDALEYYKYQMEIATGSWRHRSPLNEKIINKPRVPDKSDLDHKQSTYGDAHEKLQNPYWCKERFEMPAYESAVIQLADFVYNYDGGFELEGSVDDKDADSDTFDTEFWGKRAFMADLNDGAEFGIISHGSCYRLLRQAGLSLDFSEIWNNINDSNWPDLMDTEDMEVSRSTSRLITETDRGYHRSSGKKLKKHQSII